MRMCQFDVYAPLSELNWAGSDLELTPGIWIRRLDNKPDLRGLDLTLTEDEQNQMSFASHWLTFRWSEGTAPLSKEIVNLVLLALWLIKPTKAHVKFRFEIPVQVDTAPKSRYLLLDRFNWVPGAVASQVMDSDLSAVATLFPVLHIICSARGRLNNGLLLTLAGCVTNHWQVALICHAAAAETILTYSTKPGITRRLATAYACLVETQVQDRNTAFREFYELYSVRSDIMHGRTHDVSVPHRLPTLVRFEDILRRLWRAVLSSPDLIQVLEGTDDQRKAHLEGFQAGYTPPHHE